MKISTWNVNSVNARIEHLEKFIKKDQSDIYLLQELKTVEDGFPKEVIKSMGYNSYVNGQKAWNGVAILSKKSLEVKNISIPKGLTFNFNFELKAPIIFPLPQPISKILWFELRLKFFKMNLLIDLI